MNGQIERSFIVLGGGGHAHVVIAALHSTGVNVIGFTDPDPTEERILGVPHLGDDEVALDYNPNEVALAQGFITESGNRKALYRWGQKQGFSMPSVIHKSAVVDPSAVLESAAQIMSGAVVQPEVHIGENSVVNTNASVDHECWIGDNVHISPGGVIAGGVRLGNESFVGANATVIDDVLVGANSTIGAGAVVINDVPSECTVVGVPAAPVNP